MEGYDVIDYLSVKYFFKKGTNILNKIEYDSGTKEWFADVICEKTELSLSYLSGRLIYHRLDGPAIESSTGYKAWYFNGKRHRLDGPAIEWEWEWGIKSWYVNGIALSPEKEAIMKLWWENGRT